MKKYYSALILIPVFLAVLTLLGYGQLYRRGMAVACVLLLLFSPEKNSKKLPWIITASLLFSGLGDWMLCHQNGMAIRFIYGVALFGIAHIGYVFFCLANGKMKWRAFLLILSPYLLFFIIYLRPALTDFPLLIAVLGYLILSCLSLAAAMGLQLNASIKYFFLAGVVCLVFSDTLIALSRFMGYDKLTQIMLATYYLSQILITFSMIKKTR